MQQLQQEQRHSWVKRAHFHSVYESLFSHFAFSCQLRLVSCPAMVLVIILWSVVDEFQLPAPRASNQLPGTPLLLLLFLLLYLLLPSLISCTATLSVRGQLMFTKCESGNVLQTRTSPAAPSPPSCSPHPTPITSASRPHSQCSVLRFIIGFEYNGIVMKCAANDGDGDGDCEVQFCGSAPGCQLPLLLHRFLPPFPLVATPAFHPAHPSPPTLPLIFLLLLPFIRCLCQVQAKQLFLCFCVLLAEWRPNATRCVCVFEWECVCAMVCVCVSLWPCNLSW